MDRSTYFRPIIALTAALCTGIVIARCTSGSSLWAYPIIISFLAYLIYRIKQNKGAAFAPYTLFFFIGWISIKAYLAPILPSEHITNFIGDRSLQIVGIIDSDPISYAYGARYDFRIESVGQHQASGKIRLTVRGHDQFLSIGERVQYAGQIREIHGSNNPGGFNYAQYMQMNQIRGASYVRQEKLKSLGKRESWVGEGFFENHRRRLSLQIEKNVSGQTAQILKALVIGERGGISREIREAFNRAGAAHMLAVSGLHVGMVAGASMFILGSALSYAPWLTAGGRVRKVAAIATSVIVVAYGLLTGMSPATQRAVAMALIFLLGFLVQKEHDLVNTVFIAAFMILVFYPPALFSISFQLSFAAVIGIIVGFSAFGAREDREIRWHFKALKVSVLMSLFAIGASAPLVMHYFNQISWVGVISNIAAMPLLGCWVLPVALAGALANSICPALAGFLLKLSGIGASALMNIVVWIGAVPWASMETITPSWLEIFAAYGLLWALMLWKQNQRRADGLSPMQQRHNFRIWAIGALCALTLAADACYWIYERWFSDQLRVTALDVGQGTSTLIEMPSGYCILIDGGGADNKVFDVGEKIVAPYLRQKKINAIDLMVLSHPNRDHVNGLIYIARHFNVRQLLTNGQGDNSEGFRELIEIARKRRINIPSFGKFPREFWIHGALLNILHPNRSFDPDKADEKDVNDNSIVLKLQYGQTSFLITGDVTRNAEIQLVHEIGSGLRSQVLFAPHHGSSTSSSEEFLKCVSPEIIVISAGWKNRFGFPQPEVMDKYAKYSCQTFQTAVHGAIYLVSDGNSLDAKPTSHYKGVRPWSGRW